MKKGLLLTLLGAFAFIVFLVATAPASLLSHAVQRVAPVELEGVSGTVWSGAAQRIVAPQDLVLGPLSWRLHGWRLLLGEIRLSLEIPSGTQPLNGRAEAAVNLMRTLTLSDVAIEADTRWVFTQLALPLAADGRFHLQIPSASMQDGELPLIKGQLEWREARIVYPQPHALGAYRVTVRNQPETDPEFVLAEIRDIDSPLNIDGTVKIDRSGDYEFTARLATTPTAPQILKNTLQFLGDPGPDGSVTIERRGNAYEDYAL